ncbi:flagellar basal body protein FliL [Clostridium fermenticellae]|uniref:Flagellar protein FliL n=1 Tax=Clostridium fermenticellae TaxID=2068654 RepID=A0A386H4T9_9CLOT|nr:flagellar basal body-associated FliL family protein [Clostridium fermenticellae]AYD40676.1 flagellar basal body protein FliL [Clostridium fermenticellae]
MENKVEKKGKRKLIILVLVLIIIVCVGVYLGYSLFLKDKLGSEGVSAKQQQLQQTQAVQAGQTTQTITQQIVSSKTYELSKDDILVNLADTDSSRYLKVNIYLGYDSKKLDSELEEKQPIIMDTVINVLRTKKAADISSAKGLETVKVELIQRINPLLQKGQINNIYFSNVLVQ